MPGSPSLFVTADCIEGWRKIITPYDRGKEEEKNNIVCIVIERWLTAAILPKDCRPLLLGQINYLSVWLLVFEDIGYYYYCLLLWKEFLLQCEHNKKLPLKAYILCTCLWCMCSSARDLLSSKSTAHKLKNVRLICTICIEKGRSLAWHGFVSSQI